jgi:hypothetical protein
MNAPPRAPRDRRYSTQSWRRVREFVRQRDGRTCQVCGRREPEYGRKTFPVDHRYPGGDFYDPDGLWLLCWSCNTSKAGMDVDTWRARAKGHASGRPAVVSRSAYARTTADVTAPLESPRILPTTGIGRPSTSDPAYLHWAMELTGVSRQPRDHGHGHWDTAPQVHTKAGLFAVCPSSCPRAPVRWRVIT